MKRAALLLLALGIGGNVTFVRGDELRLIDAARKGDGATLRVLLQQPINVAETEPDGTTALHWTAYWNDEETTAQLLRAGAAVNAANDFGVTPLWLAAENGNLSIVRRLLQSGANPNVPLRSGETPLMTAARTGNEAVVAALIEKGAQLNVKERVRGQTALMWAVAQRHPDVVDVLLKHGADVHERSNVWPQVVSTTEEQKHHPSYRREIQQGGYTALLFAARVGDLASARLLVAAGADVNSTAPYGTSAMVVAAHAGYGDVAAFLLEKGADPDRADAGYTALHAAILRQDEQLVKALLAHGADPNLRLAAATPARRQSEDYYLAPPYVGATPFWLAARFTLPSIMRLLAAHGADPRAVHHMDYWAQGGGYGVSRVIEGPTTSLMAAAGMGARLYGLGATPERQPAEAEALILEAVKVATELGVDVNAVNADGNTVLHFVAGRGYDTVVRFLVENGAYLDVRNKKGQTPLGSLVASPRPNQKVIELLTTLGAKP
jgi:ankyrin repeat protein